MLSSRCMAFRPLPISHQYLIIYVHRMTARTSFMLGHENSAGGEEKEACIGRAEGTSS